MRIQCFFYYIEKKTEMYFELFLIFLLYYLGPFRLFIMTPILTKY